MLQIDRLPEEPIDKAPTTEEATVARDAAKAALEQVPHERAVLMAEIAEGVSRGDFESSRAARDKLSLLEDRAAFARGQLQRAELALVMAEGLEAERAAKQAAGELEQAFAREESARAAHQEATAARCGAQARMQSYQVRLESLRQQHEEAKRRIAQESP